MKKIGFILAILIILVVAAGLRLYRFSPPATVSEYAVNPTSQLPPGLHSDEAFDSLGALHLLQTPSFVPYSTIDQGRTVAHLYLTALVIAVAGPVAEASRIASLIAGLIAMAGMAWLVYELFRAKVPKSELRIMLLIAIAEVAGTYWFVHFGRMGLDNIGVPALMLPAFAMLWRWLHRPTGASSVLAGALVGAVLYSYLASYFVPLVVGLTIIIYWWTTARRRLLIKYILIFVLAFALVILPLVNYAVTESVAFTHRIDDTQALSSGAVIQNAILTIGGVFVQGDGQPFYNLPNRPLLDPIQSLLAVIGLWVVIRRFKQPEYLFVVLWIGIMLLPGILSNSSPAFNRIAGAVPGILLLVTLGSWQLYRTLTATRWKWLGVAALVVIIVTTFTGTAYDYFVRWPNAKGLTYSFSLAERIQAEAVTAFSSDSKTYLSPSDSQRSIFAYLWQEQPLATSFNGRRCTIIPRRAAQDTHWVIQALEDKRTPDRLAALYQNVDSQAVWVDAGSVVVERLSIEAGATARVPTTTLATLGDLFQLRDYRLIDPPARGGRLRARLLWEPIGSTTDDWVIATYLIDSAGQIRAQEDRQPCDGTYSTSRWQPTELISDDRVLAIPDDLPAGEYQLAIVIYRLSDNARLPVRGPADQPVGDMLSLGSVTVP